MRFLRFPTENRRTWIAAAALAVVAIIVVGVAIYEVTKPKNVSNPNIAFVNTSTDTTSTSTKTATPKALHNFVWALYGLNDQRTRDFQGPADLKPPFKVGWSLGGNAPVEFPPVVDGNALYFMDDNSTVNKVNAKTGKRYWRTRVGMLSAATPALDVKDKLLFVPILSTTGDSIGSVNGEFVAMSMKKGTIKWKFPVPSGTESSPIVWGNNVYFGDQGGTVYDLNVNTGKVVWSFPTGGAEKGGPTLDHGVLFFGNYAGQLFAVNATTGKEIWESNVSGGTIYASPTVAFDRVYVGSTNGFFYSFSEKTGALAWSINTGRYVYSSAAAVPNVPGLGPTIFFGSYNGTAYAVNAQNGNVDWTHSIGDSISGAASIVNNVVYFSGVYHGITQGLNLTNGDVVFHFSDGAYTATIATPRAVYLCGHYRLYELLPEH